MLKLELVNWPALIIGLIAWFPLTLIIRNADVAALIAGIITLILTGIL